MDWSVLHALNNFMARNDAVEDPLLFYVEVSEALFACTLIGIFLVARGLGHAAWRRAAVAAALSAGVALAIGKVISEFVERARPFVADPHGVHVFSAHAADPGFPSDHATAAFAIAVAILQRKHGLGIAALLAAVVLSVGRVALGIHFPSDVLAGAALGSIVALALGWPPIKGRIDALADSLGRPWDRLLARTERRLGRGA
jgi:undecaprenyl-diphosphatase